MSATATAEAHRQIEQLAARMLDVLDAPMSESFMELLKVAARQEATVSHPALHAAALGVAAESGHAEQVEFEAGRHLALSRSAVAWSTFMGPFSIREWWPGWCQSTEPLYAFLALRAVGPREMMVPLAKAGADDLAHDQRCEVCGSDSDVLQLVVYPFGPLVVMVYAGTCCIDLLKPTSEPIARTTYQRFTRNEPCPCGSGYKVKRCCGGAR